MRIVIVLLLMFATAAWAGPPATSRDTPTQPQKTQPAPAPSGKAPIIGQVMIGERAPDFVLDASTGKAEKLSRTRGSWVLLAFSERYEQVTPLDSIEAASRKLRARVVAVCHEKQQRLLSASPRTTMLTLADATGEVSAMYGLFDWQLGTTQPGFFVLDPAGIVRLAVLGQVFPPDQMLDLLQFATTGLQGAGP